MVSSGMLRRVALVRTQPEDTILHSHRRENLKSYVTCFICEKNRYSQRITNMNNNNNNNSILAYLSAVSWAIGV
jgi:hypothetical protein